MARKRQKSCRACKKRPVWRGGDVKDPGLYCKRCYGRKWGVSDTLRRLLCNKEL
jgi:hypothetical protein